MSEKQGKVHITAGGFHHVNCKCPDCEKLRAEQAQRKRTLIVKKRLLDFWTQ